MASRSLFLAFGSVVGLAVGSVALAFPQQLLASKGVTLPNAAAVVWMREVGINIFAHGVVLFLVRKHADNATLRAVFIGNAVLHAGLFPIEIAAYQGDVITSLSGILPNSALHLLMALSFAALASRIAAPKHPRGTLARQQP